MKRTGKKRNSRDFGRETEREKKGLNMDTTKIEGSIECDTIPRTSSDLVVHTKKLSEVRSWLVQAAPRGILLLTGPSGSGKTTSVQVLCEELKITLSEWADPDHEDEDASFLDFLHSRPTSRQGVLLVRHLPHLLYSELPRFHEYLRSIPISSSIIFCLPSTSAWHLNPVRLFNARICAELSVSQIVFNPLAVTFIKKALKKVIGKTSCRDSELDEIVKKSEGDLRKALILLDIRLRCGKGAVFDRSDAPITMFHSIGRILYAKRSKEKDVEWMKTERLMNDEELRRPPPDFDVNSLIEESPDDPIKLISFVHEHIARFSPLSSLHRVIDSISLSDAHLNVWQKKETFNQYALQTVARSSLFHNYRETGPEMKSKYTFNNPLSDQLIKELRKLSDIDRTTCYRREYYCEIVPTLSRMGRLPPSMDYFDHPIGSEAWKQGLDRWNGLDSSVIREVMQTQLQEEEDVEFEIIETDSDNDSF